MDTQGHLKRRFKIDAGLALAFAALLILTLISHEWIEVLTGWDPDNGNGSVEWMLVGVLFLATITLSVRARSDWRQMQAAAA